MPCLFSAIFQNFSNAQGVIASSAHFIHFLMRFHDEDRRRHCFANIICDIVRQWHSLTSCLLHLPFIQSSHLSAIIHLIQKHILSVDSEPNFFFKFPLGARRKFAGSSSLTAHFACLPYSFLLWLPTHFFCCILRLQLFIRQADLLQIAMSFTSNLQFLHLQVLFFPAVKLRWYILKHIKSKIELALIKTKNCANNKCFSDWNFPNYFFF